MNTIPKKRINGIDATPVCEGCVNRWKQGDPTEGAALCARCRNPASEGHTESPVVSEKMQQLVGFYGVNCHADGINKIVRDTDDQTLASKASVLREIAALEANVAAVEEAVLKDREACEEIVRQLCDDIMARDGVGGTLELACKARHSIRARTSPSPSTGA